MHIRQPLDVRSSGKTEDREPKRPVSHTDPTGRALRIGYPEGVSNIAPDARYLIRVSNEELHMGGIELRNGTLVVDREPNLLDELAIGFSRILDRVGIEHVYVAGYVSILAGRARSTQDVDVIIEEIDEATANELGAALADVGFWGALPLDSMYEMLENGDTVWIAPEDQVTPHLDVTFARDQFDRASLNNAISARIGNVTIPIGPLELQIAYKLYLGAEKDLEDAVHLHTIFEESLRVERLETWVTRLDVDAEYERLKRS